MSFLVKETATRLERLKAARAGTGGASHELAWNESSVALTNCAQVGPNCFVVAAFS